MPPENTENQQEKPKKKSRLVIVLIFTIPLVLAIAVLSYLYVADTLAKASGEEGVVPIKSIKKTTLKSFTVNLADTGYRRYLRTTITMEYASKEIDEEMEIVMHRIKHTVLNVLRSKKVTDLNSLQKTEELRLELLNAVNSELTQGEINGLYFEEFIIQ